MFQHIAFSFLTTISVVGLLRATWEPIVACLGTNPYVYRVLLSFFLVTSLYFVIGSLFAVMETIVKAEVHRLVIINKEEKVCGVVSLSDILSFLVLRPSGMFTTP